MLNFDFLKRALGIVFPPHFMHDFSHSSHQKIDSNSRTFQHFFSLFPGHFVYQSSRTFPGLSSKFQDFPGILWSCMNSNNKISLLQNENIHLVEEAAPSTVNKKINTIRNIYILYYYDDLSLLEIDPLYY